VNPLSIDDRLIGGSPFAIEKRCDPPIAIGGPGIDEPANGGQEIGILGLVLRATQLRSTTQALSEIGSKRCFQATA
jgi:hypothetical protein